MFDKNGIYFADGEEGLWSNEYLKKPKKFVSILFSYNWFKINRTIQNYLKKVQCIIEQYDNYTIKQINLTVF